MGKRSKPSWVMSRKRLEDMLSSLGVELASLRCTLAVIDKAEDDGASEVTPGRVLLKHTIGRMERLHADLEGWAMHLPEIVPARSAAEVANG